MPWLEKLRQRSAAAPSRAGGRPAPEAGGVMQRLETHRLVSLAILATTVAAILLISYVGVSPVALPIQTNQRASVRIVAADTFEYESRIRTEQQREQLRNRVPPVFRLELAAFQQFAGHLHELAADLDRFERESLPAELPARPEALRIQAGRLEELVAAFNAKGPYRAAAADVATILGLGHARFRQAVFENGLLTLRELYGDGIYDDPRELTPAPGGGFSAYQVRGADDAIAPAHVQSREEALTLLRINLAAEGVGREGAAALFRLFRNGLTPNLIFDSAATSALKQKAAANLRPVRVTVQKGEVLVETGTIVSAEQMEAIVAHREHLLEKGDVQISGQAQLFGRMLLVLAMVLAAVFYIRLEDRATLASNSRLGLLAAVVILNLALVRLTYELGDIPFFVRNPDAAATLPYLAPTALAPLIVAVLLGAGPAIFMALVISLFTGVIYGNRLDVLVVTFFASMVGIFVCRKARQRGRVLRAGTLAGLCVAFFALLLGLAEHWGAPRELLVVLKQMAGGLATGLLTGVAVVGLIPILETLFRRTTDITLLELTDFNHPLLRLMQMEAPGTYHHSLMVANLAEHAAGAIGANALVCRVCALYHDIGKMVKPEYFTENQRERANPHDDCTPAVSAMVIKGHVSEGVELAVKHRLPRVVVDVIRQHHGTTLIQYFYQRARKEARGPGVADIPAGAAEPVLEHQFRYDGPKPRSRECAIIFFADCVEAASRSLRTVTPQHLAELIDRLFRERIDDGQLDEAPLTLEDIAKLKTSFEFTLLNMLHSRVAYPVGEPVAPIPPEPRETAPAPRQSL